MGDQQPATNGQGDAPDRPADAWGEDITAARKEDLATRQRDWAKQPADTRGVSAFAGYPLTGADVSGSPFASLLDPMPPRTTPKP